MRPNTLAGLYEHMLESAQSANMKAGVVGGSIGGVGSLRPVLCDFEPDPVVVFRRFPNLKPLPDPERIPDAERRTQPLAPFLASSRRDPGKPCRPPS